MKIVLISTPIMDYEHGELRSIAYDATRECPPFGLYLLARILSQQGHDVNIVDLIADGSADIGNYSNLIIESSLVGISATTLSWPTAVDIVTQVRTISPEVSIVLGGVHPTMFPNYILKRFDVNYVVCGEAEISLPLLCQSLESSATLSAIPGLWRKSDDEVRGNPIASRLSQAQLSQNPVPDFSQLPERAYKGLSIESSRGCKFNCLFCSATYRQCWVPLAANRFVDNIEQVLEHVNRTSLGILYVIDDEFSSDPSRCITISNELRRRGINVRMTYDSRATDIQHDGLLDHMAEFTYQLLIGAECGYDAGLRRIGKGITTNTIESAARMLLRYNLSTRADFSFIIGFPWESVHDIQRTLQFAGHLFSEYGVRILIQWYVQMPDSRLWQRFRADEIVHEAMYDHYGFFRDLYLFRSGNSLKPSEIWDIARSIESAKAVSRLRYPEKQMIEHSLPMSIYENFPYYDDNEANTFRKHKL